MARRSYRSSKKSRNPRRGTRRGPRGWIKRHGKWVKGALARGGRKARSARRGKSRSHRKSARRSSRRTSRKGYAHRRNPAAGQLRDGTMVSISGRSVTITNNYGESYEYDEVSGATLRALASAKNFSAAQKACNRSGILRSINPKRRGRKSRR